MMSTLIMQLSQLQMDVVIQEHQSMGLRQALTIP